MTFKILNILNLASTNQSSVFVRVLTCTSRLHYIFFSQSNTNTINGTTLGDMFGDNARSSFPTGVAMSSEIFLSDWCCHTIAMRARKRNLPLRPALPRRLKSYFSAGASRRPKFSLPTKAVSHIVA